MPKSEEKDKDIPLPPPSGPGSIRTQHLADPSIMHDRHANPRRQERRLDLIGEQAAATAVPLKSDDGWTSDLPPPKRPPPRPLFR